MGVGIVRAVGSGQEDSMMKEENLLGFLWEDADGEKGVVRRMSGFCEVSGF